MKHDMTPLLWSSVIFGWVSGIAFLCVAIYLSWRSRRLHPLLLVCISAMAFSWIEAPYDYVMYAQFAPAIPRMPSWWPVDKTYGGLPSSVPAGYISYFALPAVIAAYVGRRLIARFHWRRPLALLTSGLAVGFLWALMFNAGIGARLGVFYYGRVIRGLAIFEGTKHQYPLYDALAMGIQVMVFTYLLGRTDTQGRTVIDRWADSKTGSKLASAAISVLAVILLGHVMYLSVYAPHAVTKRLHEVNVGPREQLFPGVPNQPD